MNTGFTRNHKISLGIAAVITGTGIVYMVSSYLRRKKQMHHALVLNKDLSASSKFLSFLKKSHKNSKVYTYFTLSLMKGNKDSIFAGFLNSWNFPEFQNLLKYIDLLVLTEDCDSTQNQIDYYKTLNQKQLLNTLFISHNQFKGKGRQNNTWISIPGNIYMTTTYSIPFDISPLKVGAILLWSIAKVLQSLNVNSEVKIKWPNDILVEGHKISGIISESYNVDNSNDVYFIKSGIGINIESNSNFKGIRSLMKLEASPFLRERIICFVISEFFETLTNFSNEQDLRPILKNIVSKMDIINKTLRIVNSETKEKAEYFLTGIDHESLLVNCTNSTGEKFRIFPKNYHLEDGCEAFVTQDKN